MPRASDRDVEIAKAKRNTRISLAVAAVIKKFLDVVPQYSFYSFCAYRFSLTANEFAGKTTVADIGAKILLGVTWSESISYTAGGMGVAYGLLERHRRKKSVAHVQSHNQRLEYLQDPKRTTSHLTPMGGTNPIDQD